MAHPYNPSTWDQEFKLILGFRTQFNESLSQDVQATGVCRAARTFSPAGTCGRAGGRAPRLRGCRGLRSPCPLLRGARSPPGARALRAASPHLPPQDPGGFPARRRGAQPRHGGRAPGCRRGTAPAASRLGSRPGAPRQRAGGGARARARAGGAPGPGPLNRRRARPGPRRGRRAQAGRASGDLLLLGQVRTGGAGELALDGARPPGPPRAPKSSAPPSRDRPAGPSALRGARGWGPGRLCEGGRLCEQSRLWYVLWVPAVDKEGGGEMVPIQQEYIFSPCFLVLVTERALAQTKEEDLCGLTV
ncbi:uncharacterized protein LOC121827154 [Peromyscus maniculatus bairdii]|uniref:uncharacterized protein LOC121827154 n=1 Tax=Peromyscus maniculatus bairdii TaxID=230844 RepID=UPI003FD507DA